MYDLHARTKNVSGSNEIYSATNCLARIEIIAQHFTLLPSKIQRFFSCKRRLKESQALKQDSDGDESVKKFNE